MSLVTNALIHSVITNDTLYALKSNEKHTCDAERLQNPAGSRDGSSRYVSLIRTPKYSLLLILSSFFLLLLLLLQG